MIINGDDNDSNNDNIKDYDDRRNNVRKGRGMNMRYKHLISCIFCYYYKTRIPKRIIETNH